jgi:hypothetical protein
MVRAIFGKWFQRLLPTRRVAVPASRLDQHQHFFFAARPRTQSHVARAACRRDVDLDAGDAALRTIEIVEVLEQRVDIRLFSPPCQGRGARGRGQERGGNDETK